MWDCILLYLFCGVLAGLAAGLFGVGGGIVVVPFLAWLLPEQGFPERVVMLVAVATSLATIVVTSISSIAAHQRRGAIDWGVVRRLAPGIIGGSLFGGVVAEMLPVPLFKALFGLFLSVLALRMFWSEEAIRRPRRPVRTVEFIGTGALIGIASSILGIGGGTLSVPYLERRGLNIKNAVAVSSACGFPIALAGTATYALLGWEHSELQGWMVGYVHVPAFLGIAVASVPFAPLGARIAHQVPGRGLKRGFAIVLGVLGARLLWQGIGGL